MISRRVVERLNLPPVNAVYVTIAAGERETYTYLISLMFQNKTFFPSVKAGRTYSTKDVRTYCNLGQK